MKTILYFDMVVVAKLIEHAANSTTHRGTCNQLLDENFETIENPAIPPGLILVKDDGVYLRSNGTS